MAEKMKKNLPDTLKEPSFLKLIKETIESTSEKYRKLSKANLSIDEYEKYIESINIGSSVIAIAEASTFRDFIIDQYLNSNSQDREKINDFIFILNFKFSSENKLIRDNIINIKTCLVFEHKEKINLRIGVEEVTNYTSISIEKLLEECRQKGNYKTFYKSTVDFLTNLLKDNPNHTDAINRACRQFISKNKLASLILNMASFSITGTKPPNLFINSDIDLTSEAEISIILSDFYDKLLNGEICNLLSIAEDNFLCTFLKYIPEEIKLKNINNYKFLLCVNFISTKSGLPRSKLTSLVESNYCTQTLFNRVNGAVDFIENLGVELYKPRIGQDHPVIIKNNLNITSEQLQEMLDFTLLNKDCDTVAYKDKFVLYPKMFIHLYDHLDNVKINPQELAKQDPGIIASKAYICIGVKADGGGAIYITRSPVGYRLVIGCISEIPIKTGVTKSSWIAKFASSSITGHSQLLADDFLKNYGLSAEWKSQEADDDIFDINKLNFLNDQEKTIFTEYLRLKANFDPFEASLICATLPYFVNLGLRLEQKNQWSREILERLYKNNNSNL
jgi:hypothetical protein